MFLLLFRPEKNHILQLKSFATLLKNHPELKNKVTLVCIGSTRNPQDRSRVKELNELSIELDIQVILIN